MRGDGSVRTRRSKKNSPPEKRRGKRHNIWVPTVHKNVHERHIVNSKLAVSVSCLSFHVATCPRYNPAFARRRLGQTPAPPATLSAGRAVIENGMDGWIILEQTKDPDQHGYVCGWISRRTVIIVVLWYWLSLPAGTPCLLCLKVKAK